MKYCYCLNFDFGTVYVYLVQSPPIVVDDLMAADVGVFELMMPTMMDDSKMLWWCYRCHHHDRPYYRIWSTITLIVIKWLLPLSQRYIVYFVEWLVYVYDDSADDDFYTCAYYFVVENCCCWRCCCCCYCCHMYCSHSDAVT